MKNAILLKLEEFKKNNDGSLIDDDFKKISFYYGLAVPVICEIYCTLRGFKISSSERKTLSYLGATTGLFDDFFDEKKTPSAHILELINNPNDKLGNNSHEKLFLHFYLLAFKEKSPELIKKYSNLIYDAQILSKNQLKTQLSRNEILEITLKKGGISIFSYRALLDGEITIIEQKLLFKIGLLGQLINDIFDIYKDNQAGIHTLATISKTMVDVKILFNSILVEVFELINQTDFETKNKKKFSRLIAVVASRGLVCLDQLIKLEKNGVFEISKHSREELICDMGKIKNNIKWIGFYLIWDI